jgi:hypothetical protein
MLEERMTKLVKIATKIDAPKPALIHLGRYEQRDDESGELVVYLNIEITNAYPQINGWILGAAIEHLAEGANIVRLSPHLIDQPNTEEFFTVPSDCDHCNVKRQRKNTYIFVNLADNTRIQIGSTCMKDYTGHSLQVPYFEALDDLIDSMERMRGGGGGRHFSVRELTYAAAMAIKEFGYQKRDGRHPTRQAMMSILLEPRNYNYITLTDDETDEINKAIEWILGVEPTSDFIRNLKTIVEFDKTDHKYIGFIAALIPAYRRQMNWTKMKEIKEAAPKVPVITGEKVEINGTIINTSTVENDYGTRYVITVLDDRGFKVWGTEPSKCWGCKVGDRIAFTASTVEASDKDETFGFYKRPTKVVHTPTEETATAE